jgi:hypothetical protein
MLVFKPISAGSQQSFNHPMILSFVYRARPVQSLLAALRRVATRRCCCSRRSTDDVPSVREPRHWLTNFGTERHWNFQAEPNPLLNGRRLPLNMGKVLGGGSSVNGMIWSRGHKNDWDYFAKEAGDPGWTYEMNPSSACTVGSRTGREPPTRGGVARAASSMWNRRVIPIRWPRRCWRLFDPSTFPPSMTKTVK